MTRTKVIFLAGLGRSGTTLVGNLLGQLDGYLYLGEMRHIWDRGVLENRRCGCGAAFRDCPLWRRILDRAFSGLDVELAKRMLRARDATVRTRHLPMIRFRFLEERLAILAAEPARVLNTLYTSIHRETGCRVIVDSSKSPADTYLLGSIPEIDLYVVHMVRDPRAVAYSWWSRAKRTQDSVIDSFLPRYNPLKVSALWNLWNLLIPEISRSRRNHYRCINYERFVKSPRIAITEITEFVEEPVTSLPFLNETTACVSPCHTVSGNPNRFANGILKIAEDEEWKWKMSRLARGAVSGLTGSVRSMFGYDT